jgi:hypothetical protein
VGGEGLEVNWGGGVCAQVSRHSVRVRATQDLLALNIDLASVDRATPARTAVAQHVAHQPLVALFRGK